MTRHWETHLYTYAVALTQGAAILPEKLQGMRQKAISHGHTEGECQIVEADPMEYVQEGFSRLSVLGKAVTMRRLMETGIEANTAQRIVNQATSALEVERLGR